jgi:tetratricopeptide (TPR) repeat protein
MLAGIFAHQAQRLERCGIARNRRGLFLSFAIFLCFMICDSRGQNPFSASLQPNVVNVGESAVLSLVFEGIEPSGSLQLPDMPGINVLNEQVSTSMSWINGKSNKKTEYHFSVSADKPGDYSIPALQIQLGGKTYSSSPLLLKVVKSQNNAGTNAPAKQAFIQIIAPKTNLFLGEPVIVDIRLYGLNVELRQFKGLKADGFTVGTITQPVQTSAVFNNQKYGGLVYRTSVTPAKTGLLTLGPAGADLNLRIAVNQGRSSPFDDPFGLFRQPYRTEPLEVESDTVNIRVLPLPTENVPSGFSNAIGSFRMEALVSPTNIAVGDPITIKVKISGRGMLDSINAPQLSDSKGFKVYPPNITVQPEDPIGLQGTKTFEFAATPQAPDIQALPPIVFSYFDPDQKSYRILKHPSTALIVRPSLAAAPALDSTNAAPNKNSIPADLRNIKAHPGILRAPRTPWVLQAWFLALYIVPVLLWIGIIVWRKRAEVFSRNPRLRRQRRVERLVVNGLRELEKLAQANRAEDFHATAFRLLQERLGERLDLPSSAITEEVIEERLRPAGVPEPTLIELHELFQVSNQARYAPGQEQGSLGQQLPKLETAMQALQKLSLSLLLVFGMASSVSGDEAADFEKANRLYAEGQFKESSACYEQMLRGGKSSSALYFNLGNAYFKNGQLGRAIANYRHAIELSPRDTDARVNLQLASGRIQNSETAVARYGESVLSWFSLDEWAVFMGIMIWICFGTRAWMLWRPESKSRLGRFQTVSWSFFLLILAVFGLRIYFEISSRAGVVVVPETVARYGPMEEARTFFNLSDGVLVAVLEERGNWVQVRDAAKRTGWVRHEDIYTLTPVWQQKTAH